MKKGCYSYQIFVPVHVPGFMKAVRVDDFSSLSEARLYAREHGILDGRIYRYHYLRGMEEKTYCL